MRENRTYLNILEKYIGDHLLLEGFDRIYTFVQFESGAWEFKSISGTINYIGQEYDVFKTISERSKI